MLRWLRGSTNYFCPASIVQDLAEILFGTDFGNPTGMILIVSTWLDQRRERMRQISTILWQNYDFFSSFHDPPNSADRMYDTQNDRQ